MSNAILSLRYVLVITIKFLLDDCILIVRHETKQRARSKMNSDSRQVRATRLRIM